MKLGKALLVVDVQNDFLPGGALGVPGGDRIVATLNEYLRRFEAADLPIVLTRDWHPPVTKHFREYGGPWPVHCVAGTRGAEFSPAMKRPPSAEVVSKGMDPEEDSYSAFDAETSGGKQLEEVLRGLGAERLYIGGLATDYCVRYTARDAIARGFQITVLEDAVQGIDPEASSRTLEEIAAEGGSRDSLATLEL